MSWSWIVTFAAGFLAGSIVVGVTARFHQMDRDHLAYWAGVEAGRTGLAPRHPVATMPGRNERGASLGTHALGVALFLLGFLWFGHTVGGW